MSLFVDKFNRRKSPLALAAFGAALLDLLVFALCYAVLAEPLYRAVSLGNQLASTLIHAVVISLIGTAVCCLLFLLPDKRVVPCGFAGLAAVLGMFYAAACLLEPEARGLMMYLITLYGLGPVLVGNAVSWSIYCGLRRSGVEPPQRKTISEELRDAAAKEAEKRGAPPPRPEEPPRTGATESVSRSAQEEAMLLYEDDDEEAGDD